MYLGRAKRQKSIFLSQNFHRPESGFSHSKKAQRRLERCLAPIRPRIAIEPEFGDVSLQRLVEILKIGSQGSRLDVELRTDLLIMLATSARPRVGTRWTGTPLAVAFHNSRFLRLGPDFRPASSQVLDCLLVRGSLSDRAHSTEPNYCFIRRVIIRPMTENRGAGLLACPCIRCLSSFHSYLPGPAACRAPCMQHPYLRAWACSHRFFPAGSGQLLLDADAERKHKTRASCCWLAHRARPYVPYAPTRTQSRSCAQRKPLDPEWELWVSGIV